MRTLMTALMFVLGSGVASAQMTMAPTTPSAGSALGATSPLGIPGMTPGMTPGLTSTTPASPGSVPLGVTQLSVGGLSPAPGPLAGSGCSTVSSLSSSGMGTFDGGGLSTGMSAAGGMSGISGTSSTGTTGCGTSATTTGTVSGLVPPTSGTRSGIPLGSTEIGGGGESPLIVTPGPSSTTTSGTTSGLTPGP